MECDGSSVVLSMLIRAESWIVFLPVPEKPIPCLFLDHTTNLMLCMVAIHFGLRLLQIPLDQIPSTDYHSYYHYH